MNLERSCGKSPVVSGASAAQSTPGWLLNQAAPTSAGSRIKLALPSVSYAYFCEEALRALAFLLCGWPALPESCSQT